MVPHWWIHVGSPCIKYRASLCSFSKHLKKIGRVVKIIMIKIYNVDDIILFYHYFISAGPNLLCLTVWLYLYQSTVIWYRQQWTRLFTFTFPCLIINNLWEPSHHKAIFSVMWINIGMHWCFLKYFWRCGLDGDVDHHSLTHHQSNHLIPFLVLAEYFLPPQFLCMYML